MAELGRNLYKTLHQHMGFSPEIATAILPLDFLFNMEYTDVRGDKFYFANLETIPVGDGTEAIDPCGGRTMECVGSTQIELTLNRHWNKMYKFNDCRIDALNRLTTGRAVDTLMHFKVKQDELYLIQEAKIGIQNIVGTAGVTEEDVEIDGVDVLNEVSALNQIVSELEAANEYVLRSAYTLLISRTLANKIADLKSGCCDFLNGKISPEVHASVDVGRFLSVPDSWLKVGAEQYDYVIYIKQFAPYMFQCAINEFAPMTNEHLGFIAYHVEKTWDVNYKNFQPQLVSKLGYKGKITRA